MAVDPVRTKDASPDAREVLRALNKTYAALPRSFSYMAHRPEALAKFSDFMLSVLRDGKLSARHRELAYLKSAMLVDCKLCTANHTASAKRAGYSDAHIAAMAESQESPLFDAGERAILHYTTQVTTQPGFGSEHVLAALEEHFDDGSIVELTLVICLANFFTRFNNGLRTHDA